MFITSLAAPQLADLNRRLPAEAGLPPPKPGPLRPREAPPPPRPSPHTITLQTPAFRNLRLPKRLRVVYFLARTRLAQRIIMVRRWISKPTVNFYFVTRLTFLFFCIVPVPEVKVLLVAFLCINVRSVTQRCWRTLKLTFMCSVCLLLKVDKVENTNMDW